MNINKCRVGTWNHFWNQTQASDLHGSRWFQEFQVFPTFLSIRAHTRMRARARTHVQASSFPVFPGTPGTSWNPAGQSPVSGSRNGSRFQLDIPRKNPLTCGAPGARRPPITAAPAGPAPYPGPVTSALDRPATRRQVGSIHGQFRRLGLGDPGWRGARLAIAAALSGPGGSRFAPHADRRRGRAPSPACYLVPQPATFAPMGSYISVEADA
jgi:hypothetical protein